MLWELLRFLVCIYHVEFRPCPLGVPHGRMEMERSIMLDDLPLAIEPNICEILFSLPRALLASALEVRARHSLTNTTTPLSAARRAISSSPSFPS
jgi:hypothetical protein